MSVRFVVGRAGSGKTWRCLEAIRARLRENAATGNRLLLLVPEQASFQMERALIETPDLCGYTRCEVLSFQRLAYRIFSETGADPRRSDQTIGPLGRMMAIRRLIRRQRRALHLLGNVADKPGLVKQISTTFDELMRANVERTAMEETAARCEQQNPLAAAKIRDLTRLYQAYLDYLADQRIDPAQYLNLATERLAECPWLNGAEVWVDGFAGFTQQEYALLTRLARHVARMEIALLVDPGASAIEATELPKTSYSLFARTERTLIRLRREFVVAGIAMEQSVRLGGGPGPRFKAVELGLLEAHLFRSSPATAPDAPAPAAIRLIELPDRRCEVEAAVAEIQRLTRQPGPGMRYRDIAIIVRDLTEYHDLLAAALRACDIPFFIDRRQPTTHHPLIELVRSLLAIAADDCRVDSVRLTLKTGLLPLDDTAADLLENYLLAHNIAGRSAWQQPWQYTRIFKNKRRGEELTAAQQEVLGRVNHARTTWLSKLRSWLDVSATPGERVGQEWATTLFGCLQDLGAGERLHNWAKEAEADGRSDEADAHRQVWADFVELLDEFVRALGDEPMGIVEFRETVEAGLAEFNLGLAPPTLDQVLVGAIERSRHPPVRAALVLGFDEHHFPLKRSEDPLLGDYERDYLEEANFELGPSRHRQLLEERMLAYIAMTRAGERLWISYPRAGADGKPLEPSAYLHDLLRAVPGLKAEQPGNPRLQRSVDGITCLGDLAERLASELRSRPSPADDPDPAARAEWNGLYQAAREHDDWRHTLTRCLSGLRYRNDARLEPSMMTQAVSSPFVASVSRLERFASCPFAHFAEYTLSLQPRVEADLGKVDIGNVCHAILEKLIKQLVDDKQRLADLDDDQITSRIDQVAQDIAPQLAGDMMLAEARNAYLFDRSRGHLHRVTRWQRDAARAGRYRTVATEYPFGFAGGPAGAVSLKTPSGRTVYLRGVIDRVDVVELVEDLGAMVIDYKSTRDKRLDWSKVYHGLALQLVGYLLALREIGTSLTGRPLRPIAAFYLPLLEGYQTVDHPSEEKKPAQSYQLRGIADLSSLSALDANVQPGGGSRFLAARIKNDGTPWQTSDLAGPQALRALMAHVGRRMGELADSLLDGEVAVRPYRLRKALPCSWCPFRSVCRFEPELQPARELPSMKKTDVLDRVVEEQPDA
jgi:ATP-dependent helicase/nuclease subunit B